MTKNDVDLITLLIPIVVTIGITAVIKCSDTFGITWCWWWCQWHHITISHVVSPFNHSDLTNGLVPLMTLLALYDTDSYVALCFTFLDVMNTVVLVRMPLISHDAEASANIVKWLKKSCCISFGHLELTNDDAISVMWCQCWYHMTRKWCYTLFQSSSPYTKCCHWQYYQCNVMPALVPIPSHKQESC